MTLAMYISPKSVIAPIFITDTLLTDETGKSLGPVGTRNRLRGIGTSTEQATLLRKTVVLPKSALLGFAGSLGQIPDFLEYANACIDDLDSERPLRRLAERASYYPKGALAVLAALPDSDRNRLAKIYHGLFEEVEIDALGFVAAVGSGAEAAIERVRKLRDELVSESASDVELAANIAMHLSATHLTEEVYNSDERIPPDRGTWGGPLECIY